MLQQAEKAMTVEDVAERLSVSKYTVYRLIASGQLAVLRRNARSFRITEDQLQKYVASIEGGSGDTTS